MEETNKYKDGKIYKVFVPGLEEYPYIGSTTSSLEIRLVKHRNSYAYQSQKKTAVTVMFENGCEPVIELVEAFPCNSKSALETRERYWIEQNPECVNKNTPTQTWKERWNKNRDHNLAKHKEWQEKNKEHIAQYDEAYKPKRKENEKKRLEAIYNDDKAKEEWNKKRREIKNREKVCACGFKTTAGNFYRHAKVCSTTKQSV